jgi:hypothetical protein
MTLLAGDEFSEYQDPERGIEFLSTRDMQIFKARGRRGMKKFGNAVGKSKLIKFSGKVCWHCHHSSFDSINPSMDGTLPAKTRNLSHSCHSR